MLYKVYVEAFIYASSEEEAKSEGYDALQDKLACGMADVEVEQVDEDEANEFESNN